MRTAVAGLGLMGTAIAERLLAAGHELAVYNRTPGKGADLVAAGATEVDTRAELWDAADVCITMVSDSDALRAMALGEDGLVLARSAAGKTLIDMSTVSPASSAEVAAAATENGITYLRAPVSGNPMAVRAGNLGIVVSGDEGDFRAVEALLGDIGPKLFYLGGGEIARVMKLALNLMVAGTAELLAESLALGEAHGLERGRMLEVMGGSAVGSPFVKYKTAALVADDYTSTFSSRLMRKDLDLALASAGHGGVPLPVTSLVGELLDDCISSGMGDIDFMALLPRLQRAAGQDVGVPA